MVITDYALFELMSDITIGTLKFRGVHEVRIKKSIHSYATFATIKVPSIATLQKAKVLDDGSMQVVPGTSQTVTTAHKFNYRDPVTINLAYNGAFKTEFKGFVKRCNLDMPLEVECEGYIQPLRLDIDISKKYKQTSAKELLNLLTVDKDGNSTGIKVVVANDMPMYNMILTHANGEDIIKEIKKVSQGTLGVFFIDDTTLWCGLVYTAYVGNVDPFNTGSVGYRLGWNVVKDNGLKERVVEGDPVQINLNCVLPTGQKIQTASEAKAAKNKEHATVNNIRDKETLQQIANEMQYQRNYTGYEGYIKAFLQPEAWPGYQVTIVDARYPERNGVYLIESTDVIFGTNGARRTVEIGPKIGFNPDTSK